MSSSDSFMEHCGCATAHQRRCGTASVLTIVRDGPEPVQPEHVYSMLSMAEVAWKSELSCRLQLYVIPTTGDHFDRTL